MFTATSLAQIIQILGSFLLARIYLPEQFGAFSIFMSTIMFLVLLATLRYESALIIEKHNNLSKLLFNSLLTYILLFSLFLLLIVLVLPKSVLLHYKIFDFYFLIPFGVISYALYNTLISFYVREKKFGQIAKIKISIVFLILLFQIIFFYLKVKVGLILGFSLGYFIVDIYMFFNLSGKIKKLSKYRLQFILKKYFYLVKFGLPMQLVDTIRNMVLPFLIALWFGLETAGIYFFSFKIINLPLQLIGVSIGKVFYQKAAYIKNTTPNKLYSFVLKIILLTAILVIIPLILLYFFSYDIIHLAVGEKWVKASKYISILVFMLFFRTISSAISPLADILNKLHVLLVFSVLLLISFIIAMYLGKQENNFIYALKIITFSNSILYILIILFLINSTKHIKKFI